MSNRGPNPYDTSIGGLLEQWQRQDAECVDAFNEAHRWMPAPIEARLAFTEERSRLMGSVLAIFMARYSNRTESETRMPPERDDESVH